MECFDRYMERCLYSQDPAAPGFYVSGGTAGRRGDFITSPEVGPLFGAVLARYVSSVEGVSTVVDVGAGPGTLLASLDHAFGQLGVQNPPSLLGVDRVGKYGDNSLPEDLSDCLVVANELLDNLAFRIVGRADGSDQVGPWYEVFVEEHDGAPFEKLVEIPDPGIDIKKGTRVPLLEQAQQWVQAVLNRGARLIVFDYGAETSAELAERGGWLRTYAGHDRGDDPYLAPGSCDITTDVAFDQLPTPDGLQTQAEFLKRWGIDELVAEGKQRWEEQASSPTLESFRMRSRISEAEALCDPNGLGNWLVGIWAT